MRECNKLYYSVIVIVFINIFLLLYIYYLRYLINKKNLVKKYNIKKNDTIAQNTQIRKSNGDGCTVTCLYKDGKLEKNQYGNLSNCNNNYPADCII